MRYLLLAVVLCFLAACAAHNDTDLPMVKSDDPVFQLQPDHLDFGALPL
jgi:outer membrane biogenesis lipoprotein LolB